MGGLVVSVGIAWGAALWAERPTRVEPVREAPVPPRIAREGLPGAPEEFSAQVWRWRGRWITQTTWYPTKIAPHARFTIVGPVDEYEVGWPMRALAWAQFSREAMVASFRATGWDERDVAWEFGIDHRSSRAAVKEWWRRIPIRPAGRGAGRGVGLIVNTLVWGIAVAGVWLGPRAARRVMWRRRGQCLACGYSLRDAGGTLLPRCPECGSGAGGAR